MDSIVEKQIDLTVIKAPPCKPPPVGRTLNALADLVDEHHQLMLWKDTSYVVPRLLFPRARTARTARTRGRHCSG